MKSTSTLLPKKFVDEFEQILWAVMILMELLPGSLSVPAGWGRRIVDYLVTSSELRVSILIMVGEWSLIFIRRSSSRRFLRRIWLHTPKDEIPLLSVEVLPHTTSGRQKCSSVWKTTSWRTAYVCSKHCLKFDHLSTEDPLYSLGPIVNSDD